MASGWGSPAQLDTTQIVGDPVIASYMPNRLDVFARRASDSALIHKRWEN